MPRDKASNSGSVVVIANTSTAVLSAREHRIAATFRNDSNEAIYLSLGGTAVVGRGVRLAPANSADSAWEMRDFSDAVTAICTTGTKNLCVTEW